MKNNTNKLVTLGVLSALGTVLMLIEIPYPLVPWLLLDVSDVVVLVVFMLYGWKEAALVGALKALIHIMVKFSGTPYAIGEITAVIASMSYVLGMHITTNKLNLNRLFSAIITVLIITITLTTLNYLFITPIYFGAWSFIEFKEWIAPDYLDVAVGKNYLTFILVAYVPFNLIKGATVMSVYFVIEKSIKLIKTT